MRWLSYWWREMNTARVRRAQAQLELARAERQLADTQRKIKPLEEIAQRNMFSQMIRDALAVGYREPPRQEGGGHDHGGLRSSGGNPA